MPVDDVSSGAIGQHGHPPGFVKARDRRDDRIGTGGYSCHECAEAGHDHNGQADVTMTRSVRSAMP